MESLEIFGTHWSLWVFLQKPIVNLKQANDWLDPRLIKINDHFCIWPLGKKNEQNYLKLAKQTFSQMVWVILYHSDYMQIIHIWGRSRKRYCAKAQKPTFWAILGIFCSFLGKKIFFRKNDCIISNTLWFSTFMQKITKNGQTVQKI